MSRERLNTCKHRYRQVRKIWFGRCDIRLKEQCWNVVANWLSDDRARYRRRKGGFDI
jgi:hypothetical protein